MDCCKLVLQFQQQQKRTHFFIYEIAHIHLYSSNQLKVALTKKTVNLQYKRNEQHHRMNQFRVNNGPQTFLNLCLVWFRTPFSSSHNAFRRKVGGSGMFQETHTSPRSDRDDCTQLKMDDNEARNRLTKFLLSPLQARAGKKVYEPCEHTPWGNVRGDLKLNVCERQCQW